MPFTPGIELIRRTRVSLNSKARISFPSKVSSIATSSISSLSKVRCASCISHWISTTMNTSQQLPIEHIHKTRSLWSLHQWSRQVTSRHERWPSHYSQQGVSCALPNILTGYPSATECRGHWECHLTKPMPWLNTIARLFSGICKWRTGYEWVFSLKSRRIRQKIKLIRITIFI